MSGDQTAFRRKPRYEHIRWEKDQCPRQRWENRTNDDLNQQRIRIAKTNIKKKKCRQGSACGIIFFFSTNCRQ